MKIFYLLLVTVMFSLGGFMPVLAHHSSSMFEIAAQYRVQGRVLSYESKNPHSIIMLEQIQDNGQVQLWRIEGPRLFRSEQMGVDASFLNPGDLVEVCGFFLKESFASKYASVDEQGVPFRLLHGRVLTLGGKQWLWGPYGKLENCVNPDQWSSISRGSRPLPEL